MRIFIVISSSRPRFEASREYRSLTARSNECKRLLSPVIVSFLAEAIPEMFSRVTLGNADQCRTECEISDETPATVAVVYESHEGWQVNVLRPLRPEELEEFNATVAAAKQSLSHYINRMGSNPPEDATVGALSLWLMQKDDGTTLGIDLNIQNSEPALPVRDVPADVAEKIRSLDRNGRRLEAIRELRMATNCSLQQAKAWLNDNC